MQPKSSETQKIMVLPTSRLNCLANGHFLFKNMILNKHTEIINFKCSSHGVTL